MCCNRHGRPATAAGTATPPKPRRRRPRSARCTSRSRRLILQSLQAGEWKPGEAIPSEMDLAARFRVSQGTVRKAHRRAGRREPAGAPPGQGHLRRHPRRAAGAVPLPEADARHRRRRQRRPGRARIARLQARSARRPRSRARWRCAPATRCCRCAACCSAGGAPTILEDLWLPGAPVQGPDRRAAGRPAAGRCTRCSKPSSACAWCAPRKRSAPSPPTRSEAALLDSRAGHAAAERRAAVATPTTTCRWNCAAACTAPTRTTTATS